MVGCLSKQNIAVDKRAINENGTKYLGNILNNQSCQFLGPVHTIPFSYENGTEMLSFEDGIV